MPRPWAARSGARIILLVFIDGEGAGGRVVEEEIHLELEEVCGVEEHRLLDRSRLGVERVHRRIEIILGQRLGSRQVERLPKAAPRLPASMGDRTADWPSSRAAHARSVEHASRGREPRAQGRPYPELLP